MSSSSIEKYHTILTDPDKGPEHLAAHFQKKTRCGKYALVETPPVKCPSPEEEKFSKNKKLQKQKLELSGYVLFHEKDVPRSEILLLDTCLSIMRNSENAKRWRRILNVGISRVQDSLKLTQKASKNPLNQKLLLAIDDLVCIAYCSNNACYSAQQIVSLKSCLSKNPTVFLSEVPETVLADRRKLRRILNILAGMTVPNTDIVVSSEPCSFDDTLDWREVCATFQLDCVDGAVETPDFIVAKGLARCFGASIKINSKENKLLLSFRAPRVDMSVRNSVSILILSSSHHALLDKAKIERVCMELEISDRKLRVFQQEKDARKFFKSHQNEFFDIVLAEESFRRLLQERSLGTVTAALGPRSFPPCSLHLRRPLQAQELESLIFQAVRK